MTTHPSYLQISLLSVLNTNILQMPYTFPTIRKESQCVDITKETVFEIFTQNPDSEPFPVIQAYLETALLPALKGACVFASLPTKGNKPDLVGRLVKFIIDQHREAWLSSKVGVATKSPVAVEKFPVELSGTPVGSVSASESAGMSPVSESTRTSEAVSASTEASGKWVSVLLDGVHSRFAAEDPKLERALKAVPGSPIKVHENVLEAMNFSFPSSGAASLPLLQTARLWNSSRSSVASRPECEVVEIKQEFPNAASPQKKVKCSHVVGSPAKGASFDPGSISVAGAQKFIHESEGKYFFQVTASKIVKTASGQRVALAFQLVEIRGRGRLAEDYWCFKPEFFKACLASLNSGGNESFYCPSYADMEAVQIRDIPYGASVGRTNKSKKKKAYPVNITMVTIDIGGKVNPPEVELVSYVKKIHAIVKAPVFKRLYLMVTADDGAAAFFDSINDDSNQFWSVLKTSQLQINTDTPLEKLLLDEDVDCVINSLFDGNYARSDWTLAMKEVAHKKLGCDAT